MMSRKESILTVSMLAVLTIATGNSFVRVFSTMIQLRQQFMVPANPPMEFEPPAPPAVAANIADDTDNLDIPISPFDDTDNLDIPISPFDDADNLDIPISPFDIGQSMVEKQHLAGDYFNNPPEDENLNRESKIEPYSAIEIAATIPHFTQELLLVMYAAETDEFTVLLPGNSNDAEPPRCEGEGRCVRIKSIAHTLFYAFRNLLPARFQWGGRDLLFLVSTGDVPHLSRDCLDRPKSCMQRKDFAPILHFGAAFRDRTMLPSLVLMPPVSNMHLRCMAEWQVRHEVCEFLLPKRVTNGGRETPGITFGEHVNYNLRMGEEGWEDLIPQVIWRGSDYPYLLDLHPEMRSPDNWMDVGSKQEKYGRSVRGILHALEEVYVLLRPRWKAVVITGQAEFEANTKNDNPKRKRKALPWANMKFSTYTADDELWNTLGIPATGEEISREDLAKFKYHIDIGGPSGTSLSEWNNPGTLEKLALPGLLFHHVTPTEDWFHEHLVPWVHYVPVREDLSDLRERFEWAEKHDRKARAIAKAGTEFVRRMGRPEGIDELYQRHFLKPLKDLIVAYQPLGEIPAGLFGDESGFVFTEVMRCSGYDVDECQLLH